MHTENGYHWTFLQKLVFRFFFAFLLLQVLTEGFLALLFRDSDFVIWNSIAGLFTRPCLWLNDRIFHYKYIPQVWSTFSGALHTIRDIVYLCTSVVACVIWTIVDRKRGDYNRLYYWFSRCLVVVLSASVFFYGIVKVFPVQMLSPTLIDLEKPLGDLSPYKMVWKTFGYGKPFQMFCGIFEVSGALLILFRHTRIPGLLLIVILMVNVIIIDYTYNVGNVMVTAFYMLLIALFLLAPNLRRLFLFFFSQKPEALVYHTYVPPNNLKTKLFTVISALLLGSTFISNTLYAYDIYFKRMNTNRTIEYSVIKNQVLNGDTLRPILNDTLRWRSWFERVRDGKRLVTISTMNNGIDRNYRMDHDSLSRAIILHPLDPGDSSSLKFNYTRLDAVNWLLEGPIDQKAMRVELQKIDPDTLWNLLKIKRQLIIFDDWSDQE